MPGPVGYGQAHRVLQIQCSRNSVQNSCICWCNVSKLSDPCCKAPKQCPGSCPGSCVPPEELYSKPQPVSKACLSLIGSPEFISQLGRCQIVLCLHSCA